MTTVEELDAQPPSMTAPLTPERLAEIRAERDRGTLSEWAFELLAEVEWLQTQIAAMRRLATVAQQERLPVPADLILYRLEKPND